MKDVISNLKNVTDNYFWHWGSLDDLGYYAKQQFFKKCTFVYQKTFWYEVTNVAHLLKGVVLTWTNKV